MVQTKDHFNQGLFLQTWIIFNHSMDKYSLQSCAWFASKIVKFPVKGNITKLELARTYTSLF